MFPKKLYRDGTEWDWDGRPTDSLLVHTDEELEAAMANGWQRSFDYVAAKPVVKPKPVRRKVG